MSKPTFSKYAGYYDIIYKNKKYNKETKYIHKLINQFTKKKNLLDVGCGSGQHAKYFLKYNYKIVGIDKSKDMINVAKNKIKSKFVKFYKKDVINFGYKNRFDVAVSLFHVMSYVTKSKDFNKALKNINYSLKKGGIFAFDFWYTPAVQKLKLQKRTKTYDSNDLSIIRKVDFGYLNKNIYKILIDLKIIRKKRKKEIFNENFNEIHYVRSFNLTELSKKLNRFGFNIMNCYEWLKFSKPTSNCWSAVIVAQKK